MDRRAGLATLALLGATFLTACGNAGADRVLSIQATGLVKGSVHFDGNGSRVLDPGDVSLRGVKVRLVARGTRDTVAQASTDTAGRYRLTSVQVGPYVLLVDSTTIDSGQVVRIDTGDVTVRPDDSVAVTVLVSFPRINVAQARALAVGKKVFVDGVALNGLATFGDSTVHLADTSGAIRATRVRAAFISAGDSVRFLGTRSTRDGQPTLDDVRSFALGIPGLPPARRVSTAVAAAADAGLLDAAQVKVVDARITDTATVAGDYRLTVNDGSGSVAVLLDQDAGLTRSPYVPDVVIDAAGVLVPAGPGVWRLKPRSNPDLVVK